METTPSDGRPDILIIAGITIVLSTLTGLAFAAWAENSAEIFLALTQSGLNWCL